MSRSLLPRVRTSASDDGFTMIEIMISIMIVAVVASASVAYFINNIKAVNGQKQRQQAVYVADQQLQRIQALPISKLVTGRTQACVNTLFSSAAATRLRISSQDDTSSSANYDPTAATCTSPAVPTTATVTVDKVPYQLTNFIDRCWFDVTSGVCGPSSGSNRTAEFRASVDVTWTTAAECTGGCHYSTSTLLDPTSDPQFNSNISAPTGSITTPANATVYNDSSPTAFVITGTGFKSNIRVLIAAGGGTISGITQPSSTEVDFYLAGGDKPGSYVLSVINTDGGHFQTTVNEVPQITDAKSWSIAGKSLTLDGGGFEAGAALTATGSPTWTTFTRNSYTSATLANFTGPTAGASSTLTVTNPDSTTATFQITAPKETAVSPTSVTKGTATTVTVTGTGFQSTVMASATNGTATVSYVSPTSVKVTVTPSSTGTDSITLYNDDGGSSNTFSLTVTGSIVNPTITGLTRTSIPRSGTTAVGIKGTGFQTGATVTMVWSGYSWPVTVTSVTSTQVTVNVNGPGVTGSASATFKVTNPDGGTASYTTTFSAY